MTECKCFTTYSDKIERELKNSVSVSDPIMTRLNSVPIQDIQPIQYQALWDTGATNTLITNKVASDLNLMPIDRSIVYTPSGQHEANVYIIDLWLPNNFIIPSLRVTEGILSGDYELLIGMDVIASGDFSVSNFNEKTIFSFRMPSVSCTDYVALATASRPLHSTKVGMNELCPCGSGKKYKKCCRK